MLNKELLMLKTESPPVHVTLRFYGGQNSGTYYTWTSPDETMKTSGVFDERMDVIIPLTCKKNTTVSIRTDNYSGGYIANPPQEVTVDETSSTYLTFIAFRDVTVDF